MMRATFLISAAAAFAVSVPAQAANPTDAQIAHIAYTAGNLDIAAAKQALKVSKNKTVRDFAQEMVRDHDCNRQQRHQHRSDRPVGKSAMLGDRLAAEGAGDEAVDVRQVRGDDHRGHAGAHRGRVPQELDEGL